MRTFISLFAISALSLTVAQAQLAVTINGSSSGLPLTVNAGADKTICPSGNAQLDGIASGGNSASYTYNWLSVGAGTPQTVSPASTSNYTLQATDAQGCQATDQMAVNIASVSTAPVPTTPGTYHAVTECLDGSWTHYFASTGEILLSVQKNGLDIGTIGTTPSFGVEVGVSPAYATGPATAINSANAPYASAFLGTWMVMNRYWDVLNVLNQPGSPVAVRTYYTPTDVAQVTSAATLSGIQDMKFYKINNDLRDPNPVNGHQNVTSSDIAFYDYESGSAPSGAGKFTSVAYGGNFYAELFVSHFSGGGGGGLLPGGLLSAEWLNFSAKPVVVSGQTEVQLQWATTANAEWPTFMVERAAPAADGQPLIFETVATLIASAEGQYTATDHPATAAAGWWHYRIRALDTDGGSHLSTTEKVWLGQNIAVQLLPNPVHQTAWLTTAGLQYLRSFEVYDMAGKRVLSLPLTEATQAIDLHELPTGVYQFRVVAEEGTFDGKLLKAE